MAEHGFLQLCSDRRFHRATMHAFERATGLGPEDYYIEARPGGAPIYADRTKSGRLAYRDGAAHMGWAAHGDGCRGFPGEFDGDLLRKLERTVRRRAEDFPRAVHYVLFALEEGVEVRRFPG
jgi:hypothetical protein